MKSGIMIKGSVWRKTEDEILKAAVYEIRRESVGSNFVFAGSEIGQTMQGPLVRVPRPLNQQGSRIFTATRNAVGLMAPFCITITTDFSISMFADSTTSFHGTSALPMSFEPLILPINGGEVLLHRSSKTRVSRSSRLMDEEQSREKVWSHVMTSDSDGICWLSSLTPAER